MTGTQFMELVLAELESIKKELAYIKATHVPASGVSTSDNRSQNGITKDTRSTGDSSGTPPDSSDMNKRIRIGGLGGIHKGGKGGPHECPPDHRPTTAHLEYGQKFGVDVEQEHEMFMLYNEAHGRKMKNWNSAFSTWLRNARKYEKQDRERRAPSSSRITMVDGMMFYDQ